MAEYKNILYQKQRKGVLITLNRPKELNALNDALLNELDQALAEAENDSDIRAVVITGAGEAFSVGEDISGADPEMQALIEERSYFPALTSGWLLIAL